MEGVDSWCLEPFRRNIQQVTLMPYHSFGNVKYATLGMSAELFQELEDETVYELEYFLAQRGFVVKR